MPANQEEKGRGMEKASDPVCGIREGFLEEVMFEVKPSS